MNMAFEAVGIFLFGYFINVYFITVLYHRGLAHGSVTLGPLMRRVVVLGGNWLTGLDPKAWACMHRFHHRYSDQIEDPHSPEYQGTFGVMFGQLKSYRRTLKALICDEPQYLEMVSDLDFPVNWLNRNGVWQIPYLLHFSLAIGLGCLTHSWIVASAYWLGIMSHPIQGWMVNALAHKFGYRNYATPDNSRNNTVIGWLVMGEGYQNNHHFAPESARFSHRPYELDLGFGLCQISQRLRLLKIESSTLVGSVPRFSGGNWGE